eukprot:16338952-Heterocapsa_arctica.AAC.1
MEYLHGRRRAGISSRPDVQRTFRYDRRASQTCGARRAQGYRRDHRRVGRLFQLRPHMRPRPPQPSVRIEGRTEALVHEARHGAHAEMWRQTDDT